MSTPIADILQKLDQATQAYTFNGYAALVQSLRTPIVLAITVYVGFIGWSIIQGWTQLTVGQLVKHTLKIAIAYTIATQWSYFSEFIYNVFTNGPNEISSILMQAAGSSSGSANEALQKAFDQGTSIGETLWNQRGISLKLAALVIWIFNYLVSGIAMLELVTSKCGLSITLVLAPVFALFLLWNSSKVIFDRWLSVALGFALVPLFLSAVLLIVNQIMQLGLDTITSVASSGNATMGSLGTFILASIASVGLLLRAAAVAATVASGISVSSIGVAMTTGNMARKGITKVVTAALKV